MLVDGGVAKANSFCEFFTSMVNNLKEKTFPLLQFVWNKLSADLRSRTDSIFTFTYIPAVAVKKELKKLKRHKSTGVDNLPTGMLKDITDVITPPLAFIKNLSVRTGQVPN